jgi:hypothetical protein
MHHIIWLLPALITTAISAAYFSFARNEKAPLVRIFVSAHGLVAAVFYIGALAIWELTGNYRPWAAFPFLLLYLIPIASIVYSLIRFSGPKFLHVSQVANVICISYMLFIGGMAVTGDWI